MTLLRAPLNQESIDEATARPVNALVDKEYKPSDWSTTAIYAIAKARQGREKQSEQKRQEGYYHNIAGFRGT